MLSGTLTDGDEAVFEKGGQQYQSYLVMNAISYGFIHTGGPTSTGNTIAISDPDYFMPAVRITPYTEDSYTNITPHNQFTIDDPAGVFMKSTNAVTYADVNCLNVQTLKGALNSRY